MIICLSSQYLVNSALNYSSPMKKYLLSLILLVGSMALAQEANHPDDFLGKEWHKGRRDALRKEMPKNSVAVFFANAVRNRSNDVDYVYHQDPDFFYLTGYREPNAVLLVFKEKQTAPNKTTYDEIIFVQPRNVMSEMWTGRRLGQEGVSNQLGLQQAFNNSEFSNYALDFSKFDKVMFFDFHNDVRNDPRDPADLFDLIQQFKAKAGYPDPSSPTISTESKPQNLDTKALVGIMNKLRGIKTPEEIHLLRKAVNISAIGQVEVMKALKPGMSEREIQGIHEFVFKKYQAEDVGYPSIVGGGHNGCILHYIDNYKPAITAKEMVLMDLGAEYHGYTADVTRTIPSSGKFSPEQKAIYDLVLKAQNEALAICKPGTTFNEMTKISRDVINQGLAELGIIKAPSDRHLFYPHGLSHHIGLDVHDRGTYGKLEENMVISVEPGIYIPENSNCDPKWWNIAVRIEDNVLITRTGYELLSRLAPRTTEDIEKTMALPSALDQFILPDLDK
jgi:Xaa-Pro aminopeptidase